MYVWQCGMVFGCEWMCCENVLGCVKLGIQCTVKCMRHGVWSVDLSWMRLYINNVYACMFVSVPMCVSICMSVCVCVFVCV